MVYLASSAQRELIAYGITPRARVLRPAKHHVVYDTARAYAVGNRAANDIAVFSAPKVGFLVAAPEFLNGEILPLAYAAARFVGAYRAHIEARFGHFFVGELHALFRLCGSFLARL